MGLCSSRGFERPKRIDKIGRYEDERDETCHINGQEVNFKEKYMVDCRRCGMKESRCDNKRECKRKGGRRCGVE